MSFLYEERASRSRFVDVVWRTRDLTDGVYYAAADACWDLIVTRWDGGCRVLLSGPSSRPTTVRYRAGNRNVGVRFRQGSYFTHVGAAAMRDRTVALPMAGTGCFLLGGSLWETPDYLHADDLMDAFEGAGLLARDDVVDAALRGVPTSLSARSVQRHFTKATGLSPQHVRQIARARRAAALLRAGVPTADVAYQLGYADQSHLTRDVHRLTGYTPGQAQRRDEPV